jgi:hypothetical protein
MLAENLTISDSTSGINNIGAGGSRLFALVALGADGSSVRRPADTAMTTRLEMMIRHQITGKGYAERFRSNFLFKQTKLDQDTSVTGGITPSASVSMTWDRPSKMGSIITDVHMKNMVGYLVQLMLTSGNAAAFLNQES